MINPKDIYLRIKWFIQRAKRGFSDKDIWNFDIYLAKVISEGLSELKRISHGHPVDVDSMKKWENILEQIAEGFRAYLWIEENYGIASEERINEKVKKFDKAFELFKEHFRNFWD